MQLYANANRTETLKSNLNKLRDKYLSTSLEEWRKLANGAIPDDATQLVYVFTPLESMHMNTKVSWEKASDPQCSLIFGVIALLILAIACINYVSLSLTTSANRRIEVGIRKTIGAQRSQLVNQFGFESIKISLRKVMGPEITSILILLSKQYVILSLISFVIAIPVSWYVMQKWLASFQFRITIGWELFVLSTLVGIVVALATVSYHSIKASCVNPAETLKYG